jgi:Xaa-Pro aminopeptidase
MENKMSIEELIPRFSLEEYERREDLVSRLIKEADLKALVIYGDSFRGTDVRWLCDFPPRHDTYLIWPAEGEPTLLVRHFNHVPDALRVARIGDVRWGGHQSGLTATEVLIEKGITSDRIGLVGRITYKDHAALHEKLPEVEFVECDKDYSWLRVIKSEEELNFLRKAGELNYASMEALTRAVTPGVTDFELVAALEASYVRGGGEHVLHFFTSTSMENPHAFVPEQVHKARVIQNGDVIINELGAGWGGYTTQMHRAFTVGVEPTPVYQQLYDMAMRVYNGIVDVLRPGATIKDVLDVGDLIEREGLTINDGLFHGYGMGISPPPGGRTRATALGVHQEDFIYTENMVLVIQPNIVDEASGAGLQIGDTFVITSEGVEALTNYPLEFTVLAR